MLHIPLITLITLISLIQPIPLEFSRPLMGTTFYVLVYGTEEERVKEAVEAAFERGNALEAIFSDYDPESELRRLSGKRRSSLSPALCEVLIASQLLSEQSGGAFDVTVGPLSHIWRRAFRRQELPDSLEIKEALRRVGYSALKLKERSCKVRFSQKGMELDLGAIAKGYTADAMLQLLREKGFPIAWVDAGGDLALGQPPPGAEGWEVRISGSDSIMNLAHCSIATSGDRFRYLEAEGQRYAHLLDPRTGWGLAQPWQVTVVAPMGMHADGLASALSVLGPKKGEQLLAAYPGARAWFISENRVIALPEKP